VTNPPSEPTPCCDLHTATCGREDVCCAGCPTLYDYVCELCAGEYLPEADCGDGPDWGGR